MKHSESGRSKAGWRPCVTAAAVVGAVLLGWPAAAQLAGPAPRLPGALLPLAESPGRLASQTLGAFDPRALLNSRLGRLENLVRDHPHDLERDDQGAPVVRGEVLAVAPSAAGLAAARRAGFEVKEGASPDDMIGMVVLAAPPGVGARDAVRRLRALDPGGVYDFNHLYFPSGERLELRAPPASSRPVVAEASADRIGMVDTGVDASNAVFARARIEQRAFTGTEARPSRHGTAVASLLVGDRAPFRGSDPGGTLFVADVYSASPVGGAAAAIVRALSWFGERKVRVVNVSLVRGVAIVAPVGNDGPAAPPAYPASYPGVVAVTAVDARGRVLIEAGKAEHLDFAAPGADMAAASVVGGYVSVRGTSFATPLVAGRLAVLMAERDLSPAAAAEALAHLAKHARAYGRGLVAADLRTMPAAVHAREWVSD
jgi:hypothetical protein